MWVYLLLLLATREFLLHGVITLVLAKSAPCRASVMDVLLPSSNQLKEYLQERSAWFWCSKPFESFVRALLKFISIKFWQSWN